MNQTYHFTQSLARLGGDVQLFKDLATIFLQDVPDIRQEVVAGFDNSDPRHVAKNAHKLKGLVSSFDETGALTDRLATVQYAAEKEDLDQAESAYRSCEDDVDQLEEILTAIIGGRAEVVA